MRGHRIRISPHRRAVIDLMWLLRGIPLVSVKRATNIAPLRAARETLTERISWIAIATKAYALVADEFPALRRAYLRYPWPHFYQYPASAASVTVERQHEGEASVFLLIVKNPSAMPLREIAATIRTAQSAPVEQIRGFERIIRLSRLPWIIRRLVWWTGYNLGRLRANNFGTFGLSVIASHGAEPSHFITPCATALNFGPIAADGSVEMRLMIDHRIIDGLDSARVLIRLEQVLNGAIADELAALAPACAPKNTLRAL
ncbi:MAG: hypothetical protein A4S14_18675 [Proteobacteria bacterium SG_bin9]|nr:MAG: hypothetical protein A4S14_18675 [Proteobacteria bacterium SG_bin9]